MIFRFKSSKIDRIQIRVLPKNHLIAKHFNCKKNFYLDVSNWRKYGSDWLRGQVMYIQEEYNSRKDFIKRIRELMKEKGMKGTRLIELQTRSKEI